MRRLAVGFLLGTLAAVSFPIVTHGVGSGSDHTGDYYYGWVRFRFACASVEIHAWPEWPGSAER